MRPSRESPRPGAHHPEEGVHRRDGRGGHGPAFAVVPPGHQRASATLPYRALHGRARGGQPMEAPHRAEAAHRGAGRSERRARPNGAGRRIPPVGGALGAHLRRGRPRLPQVPRADEAARHGGRTGKRRFWPRWASRPRCPAAHRRAVPRTGRAACSAARRSVTKTTLRAAGCPRPRSRGRERGTGHRAAEPAPRAGSRPQALLP
jgi:hypothetical protein